MFSVILLIILLSSSFYFNLQAVSAQKQPILAEVINSVLSNIQPVPSPWSVIYGQVFGYENQSVYDDAIVQALAGSDYQDVIFIARLAELNNYSSQIINDTVRTALETMPMCGSLPETYFWTDAPPSFILYDRYMVNAYRYAQELNVPGWNITQAYSDFVSAYQKPPTNSRYGEMLWINPQSNFSKSYSGRYYDEHAETLDMFLEFAQAGINDSIHYANDTWVNTQSHWNGNYYGYNDFSNSMVECEMGNFAQIISEYRNFNGDIPYFDRVINDLQYTLLDNGFNSDGWGTVGVLKHADGNSQLRLSETLGALIALQMLCPYFTHGDQVNFKDMLDNAQAWIGLTNSGLFDTNTYAFRTLDDAGIGYSDDASLIGAMELFLYGVLPDTGHLAINASEERFNDYRTCFPVSQWKFDYENRTIRIPIVQGNLSFIFGSEKVTQNFPANGVYDIHFTDDWNAITSIVKIEDVNVNESPIPPSSVSINPSNSTNPEQNNETTPVSIPCEENNSAISVSPSPTPYNQSYPTPNAKSTSGLPDILVQTYSAVVVASIVVGCTSILYVYVKRKRTMPSSAPILS